MFSSRSSHGMAVLAQAFVMFGLATTMPTPATAAPPPPSAPHPRLFLFPPVKEKLRAKLGVDGTAVTKIVARCERVSDKPGDFTKSGYQGDNWAHAASACGFAYQLTGEPQFAQNGVKLWRALLEDVETLGDRKACVAGATLEQAIASVRRDTGYAIRFIGPHAALAYDWLHDAPGVTEAFRKQSRDCFRHWIENYTSRGYLREQPGANYHAGFVAAKTLIAIAEGGEDGATSTKFWNEVVDDVFGKQIVGNGLAHDNDGVPRGGKHGALLGGDWPEGWQYGPLSILEYAFAARALEDHGVELKPLRAWASELTLRQIYALLPNRDRVYPGGDVGSAEMFVKPSAYPFLSTLLELGSDEAASWAVALEQQLFGTTEGDGLWEALTFALRGASPVDPMNGGLPLWYFARGTRNLYARSSWNKDATFTVFTSAPRLVDDHQHPNASDFIFVRGADPLVVNPSPYATRSSLTSNALTVASNVVTGDYSPSQTGWSEADMPFYRGTKSGVVAARSDLSRAFRMSGKNSDIPLARRDFVYLPEGEIVLLDRARTPSSSHKAYLRFRTPMPLTTSTAGPLVARGTSGASALAIHAVALAPTDKPTIKSYSKGECSGPFGACRAARFDVSEYNWEVGGPDVMAVHVLDALGKDEAAADVAPMQSAPIDVTPAQNAGVIGASVYRGNKQTFVVASASGEPGETLAYGIPGANPSRHVVFDAPADEAGTTAVSAERDGNRCKLTLSKTRGTQLKGRPTIFSVSAAAEGCQVSEDPEVAMGRVSPGVGGYVPLASSNPSPGGPPMGGGTASGGCACRSQASRADLGTTPAALGLAFIGLVGSRRRRS